MSNDQKIMKAVDKIADQLDPDEILEVAVEQLGITVEELMHRLSVEVQARIEGS